MHGHITHHQLRGSMKVPNHRDGGYELGYYVLASNGKKRWKVERWRARKTPENDARALAMLAERRSHSALSSEAVTLRYVFERWKAETGRDKSGKVKQHVGSYIEPYFGSQSLDSITIDDWQAFRHHLYTRPKKVQSGNRYVDSPTETLAENTVRSILTSARSLVNYAHANRWVRYGWPTGVKIGDPIPRDVVVPDPDDIRLLIKSIESKPDDRTNRWVSSPFEFALIVRCLISFSTRRQSVLGFHVADYESVNGDAYLTFETRMNANASGLYEVPGHKGGRPYSATVSDAIRPLLERQIELRMIETGGADHEGPQCIHPGRGPILFSADGVRPWTPNSIGQRLTREAQRAGVAHLTPHVLKHFSVTTMLARGLSLEDVSVRTQTRTDTLEKTYWKFIRGRDRASAGALDDLL